MRRLRCFVIILLLAALTSCAQPETRPQGECIQAHLGEEVTTAFFRCGISLLYHGRIWQDHLPEDKQTVLLCLQVTLTNTTNQAIAMSYADFPLNWQNEAGELSSAWPLEVFAPDQLPDTYELAATEERQGVLVYAVPKGISRFSLNYQELYEDDYQGNTYQIAIDLAEE